MFAPGVAVPGVEFWVYAILTSDLTNPNRNQRQDHCNNEMEATPSH